MLDSPPTESSRSNKIYVVCLSIIVLGVLGNVLNNELLWDDVFFIKDNAKLGDPAYLWSFVSNSFWHNSSYMAGQLSDLWRPATTLILWTGGFLFGNWAPGFHAISILCALAAATTLGLLARRIGTTPHKNMVAFGIGCIYLIHPLNAEVLCMASNISDHLALAFMLGGLCLFYDWIEGNKSNTRLALAALLGFLGCCAKEFGVLFVFMPILACLIYKSQHRGASCNILKSRGIWISALMPSVIYLSLRFIVIRNSGSSLPWIEGGEDLSWATIFYGLGQSLYQSVIPIPHGAHVYIDGFDLLPVAASAATILILLYLSYGSLSKKKGPTLALTGFSLGLLFVLPSLLNVSAMGLGMRFPTRYFHLALVGFLIAILPLMQTHWKGRIQKLIPVLICFLAMLSWIRVSEWRNDLSFGLAESEYHPESAFELQNYTSSLVEAHIFDKAEKSIAQLASTKDGHLRQNQAKKFFHLSRISVYRDQNLAAASTHIAKASQLVPNNLTYVRELAMLRALDGHPEEGKQILEKALTMTWFNGHQKKRIRQALVEIDEWFVKN